MTKQTKTRLTTVGTVTVLAMLVVLGVERWKSRRAAARTAADNVQVCRRLAAQITALKGRPPRAALDAQSTSELARRVEQAARGAGLAEAIQRIDPQASRRLGDTNYLEQPTSLELRDVSLPHLATFLLALTAGGTGPHVSALRLTALDQPSVASPVAEAAEPWQAELTLTYWVFSPKSQPLPR